MEAELRLPDSGRMLYGPELLNLVSSGIAESYWQILTNSLERTMNRGGAMCWEVELADRQRPPAMRGLGSLQTADLSLPSTEVVRTVRIRQLPK